MNTYFYDDIISTPTYKVIYFNMCYNHVNIFLFNFVMLHNYDDMQLYSIACQQKLAYQHK